MTDAPAAHRWPVRQSGSDCPYHVVAAQDAIEPA